ncbi:MAG: hypothetical protein QM784_23175 [Polyangiaceae bacterium]
MSDQLSRDLASLKIDRGNAPEQASPRYGKWVLLVGLGVLVALGYPKAKAYVEGLVFQREVSTAEIFLQSPLSSQVDLHGYGIRGATDHGQGRQQARRANRQGQRS